MLRYGTNNEEFINHVLQDMAANIGVKLYESKCISVKEEDDNRQQVRRYTEKVYVLGEEGIKNLSRKIIKYILDEINQIYGETRLENISSG